MGEYWKRFKDLPPARKFELVLAVGATLLLLVIILGIAVVTLKPPSSALTSTTTVTLTSTVIYPTFPLTLTPLTPTPSPTFDPLHPYPPTQVTPTTTLSPTTTSTKTATWFLTSFPTATLKPWLTWTRTRTITRTVTVTRTRTLTPTITHTATATQTMTPTVTPTPLPERIAFSADTNGDDKTGVYTINQDGTSVVTVIQEANNAKFWDWSPDGKWLLIQEQNVLYKIRPDGTDWALIKLLNGDLDAQAVWSPDNLFIVFRDVKDGMIDLFKIEINGANLQQLTSSEEQELCPALARNKSGVYFILQNMPKPEQNGLFYKAPDFALSEQALEGIFECVDFISDGFHLAISSYDSNGWNIYTGNAAPDPPLTVLTYEGNNYSPDWFRDQTRIVYISDMNGQKTISIINSDGTGKKVVPNTPINPQHPRWMP
jgi:hypothetical protein